MTPILAPKFYQRQTERVAHELLGCTLVRMINGQRLSGRIVETEAYLGFEDPACHSFGDRRTPRIRSMYLEGGHSYVYFIYGMYFCFNVVTQKKDEPEAVLIRALQPLEGIEVMRRNRPQAKSDRDLCNGPGKLCAALAIDRSWDGILLDGSRDIFIEKAKARIQSDDIIRSKRVGISSSGEAAHWPMRFSIRDNRFVSPARPT